MTKQQQQQQDEEESDVKDDQVLLHKSLETQHSK